MTPQDFKAWRKRLGLTQAQAAERLYITTRMVQYYEAGRKIPDRTVALMNATTT